MKSIAIALLTIVSAARAGAPLGSALVFEEELRFGADEGADEYIWPYVSTTVAADARGHMYVADPAGNRVLEFDPNGRFLRLAARSGMGPGELRGLHRFTPLANGGAMALERFGGAVAKLQRFDRRMGFAEAWQKNLILEAGAVSPLGDRIGGFLVRIDLPGKTMRYQTVIMNRRFEPVKTLSEARGPLPDRARFRDPAYWAKRIGQNIQRVYGGVGVFCFDAAGRVYTARSNRYRIEQWTPDLSKKLTVFQRRHRPIPNTDREIRALVDSLTEQTLSDPVLAHIVTPAVLERAVSLAKPPPVKNPIFGLIATEDGGLLVVRDVSLANRQTVADVFAADGAYLGQTALPGFALAAPFNGLFMTRLTFKNNRAYAVLTDDRGDNRVVRYRFRIANDAD